MKTLTALLLLFALLLPAGLVTQTMAAGESVVCTVVDETGSACCGPSATHCCCDASPYQPAAPAQPLPTLSPTSAAKDIAASLPNLLVLAELPRLSECASPTDLSGDPASFAMVLPVRFCVLRCRLVI